MNTYSYTANLSVVRRSGWSRCRNTGEGSFRVAVGVVRGGRYRPRLEELSAEIVRSDFGFGLITSVCLRSLDCGHGGLEAVGLECSDSGGGRAEMGFGVGGGSMTWRAGGGGGRGEERGRWG
ncbi:hypothetical protein Tco_1310993 [Tanacetum coccineum]